MKTDMTPIEIKIEFIRHGISQAAIGRRCNVTQGHVHRVISGQSRSDRVQKIIALSISKKVTEVFPSRYPACTKRGTQPIQLAHQI